MHISTDTLKVLVADDSRLMVGLLSTLLHAEGYDVVTARDGVEAVHCVYREDPDLILLDLMMPNLNGYLVCRLLREDPSRRQVPIIMLTAESGKMSQFWGLSAGASHVMPKHQVRQELVQVVGFFSGQCPPRSEHETASIELSTTDILSRVSGLLDQKLFQTTVQNQIREIARKMKDTRDALFSLLQMLSSVLDFDVGGIRFTDVETIYVFVSRPVGPRFMEAFIQSTAAAHNSSVKLSYLKGEGIDATPGAPNTLETYHSMPLVSQDREIAQLILGGSDTSMLTKASIGLLDELEAGVSLVVDIARMYDDLATKQAVIDQDLMMGREIQMSMLPRQKLPLESGLDVHGLLEPATHLGGDYYDTLRIEQDVWIVVGDVAGKGVSAALIMAAVRSMIHSLLRLSDDPAEVLTEINQYVNENFLRHSRFMSMALLRWRKDDRTLRIGGAGHEALLLYRAATGSAEMIVTGGTVLGVMRSVTADRGLSVQTLSLEPGDTLLLYSDGVTEAVGPDGSMYDMDRLMPVFSAHAGSDAKTLVDALRADIEAFTQGTEAHDDLTLVAIRAV